MCRLPQNDTQQLDADLLAAHGAGDRVNLVRLYAIAADWAEAGGRIDAACFYLTYAYIFALEIGDNRSGVLHGRLRHYGREE